MDSEEVDSLIERAKRGDKFTINPKVGLLMVARQRDLAWAELAECRKELAEAREDVARKNRALNLLINDVQDYEAWQRPVFALEEAKAAFLAQPPRPVEESEDKP